VTRSAAIASVLLAALMLISPVAVAQAPVEEPPEWVWPPSEEVATRVEENLSKHFESGQLRAYLAGADAEQKEAMEFLLAWMPPSDLGGLPAAVLIENVELSIEAWRSSPWGAEIDPYIFHTYVLPHRVTQEPVQRWRRELMELTVPRVEGMTLTEAALEINRFAREWATYKPSSRRDQGPMTTMERGIGRCEEEMIFAICALRSAGVPARYCAVPCWTTSDGNHAWTEVFAGREDGWRYLGSCEPAGCLDNAWFTGSARRTGVVLSAGYGEAPVPPEYAEALYDQADGVTTLNSIGVYSDPGTLVLAFPNGYSFAPLDEEGEPVEPPDAHVHCFNWGGAQPLVSQPLGSEMLLGPGDYLVTTELDSMPWSGLVSVRAGERTMLDLMPGLSVLDDPVWLRYPMPPESDSRDCPIDDDDPVWLRHQRDIARNDLDRCRRSKLSPEWIEFLAGREEAAALAEQVELAGPRTSDWTSAILSTAGDTLEAAVDLLLEMDLKDFYEVDLEHLPNALGEVVRVRAIAADVPDSLWNEQVLSPRLYFQEGTMRWWTALPWVGAGDHIPGPEQLLDTFRERVKEAESTRLGAVATPEDTWSSGHASTASARACLVGLLRRHGVPARAGMGVDYVEAWSGGEWVRLVPFEEEEEEVDGPADDAEEPFEDESYVSVSYYDQSEPLTNVETWRQTRLTRFLDGHFQTWYLGQLSEGDGIVEWSLPPDEYWLFGGLRNPRGEPRLVARRFEVAPGESLHFDLDVGIPLAEWDRVDLVRREWNPEVAVEVARDGATAPLSDVVRGKRLIVLTLTGHEASFRHVSELEAIDWSAFGVSYLPLQISGLPDHPPDEGAVTVDAEVAKDVFGIKRPSEQLPLTILLDDTDATLVWLRGLRHDMPDYIERVLGGRQ